MVTWIGVGLVLVLGGYAHYAGWDGKKVFGLCILILALALTADFFMEPRPSRFG
jgi:hypothetical protein